MHLQFPDVFCAGQWYDGAQFLAIRRRSDPRGHYGEIAGKILVTFSLRAETFSYTELLLANIPDPTPQARQAFRQTLSRLVRAQKILRVGRGRYSGGLPADKTAGERGSSPAVISPLEA